MLLKPFLVDISEAKIKGEKIFQQKNVQSQINILSSGIVQKIVFCTRADGCSFKVKCFFPVEGRVIYPFFGFEAASKFLPLNSLLDIALLAAIAAP